MIPYKKDIGLLILILLVGSTVALINPLFLSPTNMANTANLIGLFGIFAIGQAIVIITGGIDLSVGSVIALLGVLMVDLMAGVELPWPFVLMLIPVFGAVIGLIHGLLVVKLRIQPFIVTLCGLLIYRGAARFFTADAISQRLARWSVEDVEYHGTTIPAGSIVVLLTAAANRDERHYDRPDVFDIHRNTGGLLSFGFGLHFCLGASLARTEGRIALEEMLKRFPDWEVDHSGIELAVTSGARGWTKMPLRIG